MTGASRWRARVLIGALAPLLLLATACSGSQGAPDRRPVEEQHASRLEVLCPERRTGSDAPEDAAERFLEAVLDGDPVGACQVVIENWDLTMASFDSTSAAIEGADPEDLRYRPDIGFADAGRVHVSGGAKPLLTVHVVREDGPWYILAGECDGCEPDPEASSTD